MSTITNERNREGDIFVAELSPAFGREVVTIASGANLTQGTVLGKIAFSCPTTGTAKAGNTGNGTLGSVVAGNQAEIGDYTIKCTVAASNAGTFKVLTPQGFRLDDAMVGVPYVSPHLSFELTDGATDFAAGDAFTITVDEGSGDAALINFAAHDGSQLASGVLLYDVDATFGAVEGVNVKSNAVVIETNLIWPVGATTAQKEAALAQLSERGISAVEGV